MANFDPAQRRETWVFQEAFRENGKPVFVRMGFNLVEYDGDPEKYIEPRPPSDTVDLLSADEPYLVSPVTDGVGLMKNAEYYNARPFEVHSFGDITIDPGD